MDVLCLTHMDMQLIGRGGPVFDYNTTHCLHDWYIHVGYSDVSLSTRI